MAELNPEPPAKDSTESPKTASAATSRSERFQAWWIVLSIAIVPIGTLLLLGLFTWHLMVLRPPAPSMVQLKAISTARFMPALQFISADSGAVAAWVNAKPAARDMGLKISPPAPPSAIFGADILKWENRPVVMLCLQNNKRVAFLFILKSDHSLSAIAAPETIQRGEWVPRMENTQGQVRLLVLRGRPRDLNFSIPF